PSRARWACRPSAGRRSTGSCTARSSPTPPPRGSRNWPSPPRRWLSWATALSASRAACCKRSVPRCSTSSAPRGARCIEEHVMAYDTIIANGTVVSAEGQEQSDIAIRGEKVAAVGRGLARNADGAAVVDATGKYVLPGALDVHVHL